MARFYLPDSRNPDLPGYYNVDNVVGRPPALNDSEDVFLVQYCLHLFKHHPTSEHKHIWSAVPLTGLIDAPTIAGIEQVQRNVKERRPGTIVDGRVSRGRGYSYGSSQFTIAILNEGVQRLFYTDWPRLDRMPACPPKLKDMVIRTLVGFKEGIPKGAQ